MLITSDRKSGCIAELTDELNILIEQTAALRKEIAENESHLKDTIINLSHDIRTPLTSMDGYFQLLLKSSDSEERQQYASVIADRLSSLKEMQLCRYKSRGAARNVLSKMADDNLIKCVGKGAQIHYEKK